jgi:hypothetical protein
LRTVLTTDEKGAIAEAEIAAAAIRHGLGVARPLAPRRYDLVFDTCMRLLRVQCKWASLLGDVVVVRCRSSRRGRAGYIRRDYMSSEVDAIAAYCGDLDKCLWLPMERFEARSAIQLRLVPARNNQQMNINDAGAFDFDATLPGLVGP